MDKTCQPISVQRKDKDRVIKFTPTRTRSKVKRQEMFRGTLYVSCVPLCETTSGSYQPDVRDTEGVQSCRKDAVSAIFFSGESSWDNVGLVSSKISLFRLDEIKKFFRRKDLALFLYFSFRIVYNEEFLEQMDIEFMWQKVSVAYICVRR